MQEHGLRILVIELISEIWEELDKHYIINSFDKCDIVTDNKNKFHRQLGHFNETHELVEDIELNDDSVDFIGFNELIFTKKANKRICKEAS